MAKGGGRRLRARAPNDPIDQGYVDNDDDDDDDECFKNLCVVI